MNGTPVTPELTAQIEKLHDEGKSQNRIAAELGIGKSTVYRQLKKEPATAATVTSPKETISETIIPDVAENVKASITDAVLEACRIYREDRLEKIEEERKYLATLEKELAELEAFLEANK